MSHILYSFFSHILIIVPTGNILPLQNAIFKSGPSIQASSGDVTILTDNSGKVSSDWSHVCVKHKCLSVACDGVHLRCHYQKTNLYSRSPSAIDYTWCATITWNELVISPKTEWTQWHDQYKHRYSWLARRIWWHPSDDWYGPEISRRQHWIDCWRRRERQRWQHYPNCRSIKW